MTSSPAIKKRQTSNRSKPIWTNFSNINLFCDNLSKRGKRGECFQKGLHLVFYALPTTKHAYIHTWSVAEIHGPPSKCGHPKNKQLYKKTSFFWIVEKSLNVKLMRQTFWIAKDYSHADNSIEVYMCVVS